MQKARKNLETALRESLQAQQERLSAGRLDQVQALEHWQKRRLSRSYADFVADPRYRQATAFFTNELYAPGNLQARDEELERMIPFMVRLLPARAVQTVADAIGLQSLTLDLDAAMAHCLPAEPDAIRRMDLACYSTAYRAVGRRSDRQRQIELIIQVGLELERMVATPLIGTTLRLCKGPARLAGLNDLHGFLVHGFAAFAAMDGADAFLSAIRERESSLMDAWLAGELGVIDVSERATGIKP